MSPALPSGRFMPWASLLVNCPVLLLERVTREPGAVVSCPTFKVTVPASREPVVLAVMPSPTAMPAPLIVKLGVVTAMFAPEVSKVAVLFTSAFSVE